MKKRKKGRRFNTSAVRQSPRQRTVELKPEELAIYVRRAEKEVLPIIKKMQLGLGTAQFLLAQQTQVLVAGDPRLTTESGMAIANNVLALWQEDIIRQDRRTGNVCCSALDQLHRKLLQTKERLRHNKEIIRSCSRKSGLLGLVSYREVSK